ncbi:UNVERIFIED_CONTAM: putative protein arginine N-methyltransferase 6, partial [Sesamum angustifolium]
VKYVDCFTVTIEELESVSTTFKFRSMMRAPFHGFAFWFDVEFSAPALFSFSNNPQAAFFGTLDNVTDTSQRKKRANPSEALVLSTAPEDPPTHWQQQLGPINRPATDPIAAFGKSQLISFTWLTLIYFYDPIDVEQDQLIEGSNTIAKQRKSSFHEHPAGVCIGWSFFCQTISNAINQAAFLLAHLQSLNWNGTASVQHEFFTCYAP